MNVRFCRREGHELGPLIVQDPAKKEASKLDLALYVKKDSEKSPYSSEREIVTLLYFWEYPTGVDEFTETKEV